MQNVKSSILKYSIVITACPNKKRADTLATILVEKRLAACVQIFPVESTYVWNGKTEKAKEYILWAKTKTALFSKIKKKITNNHPYKLPEIISIPVQNGSTAYFSWIDKNVIKG